MRFKNEEDKHRSFLSLFTAHEAAIHRYVRSLVYKREDALDVMQKTAIVLWKKFDQLKKEDKIKKFIDIYNNIAELHRFHLKNGLLRLPVLKSLPGDGMSPVLKRDLCCPAKPSN